MTKNRKKKPKYREKIEKNTKKNEKEEEDKKTYEINEAILDDDENEFSDFLTNSSPNSLFLNSYWS